jgi:delta14-sterol reductase
MQDLLLPVSGETLVDATLMFLGFVVFLFVGSIVLPGIKALGFTQPSGDRKTYKLSGLMLFLLTHVLLVIGTFALGLSLTPLLSHFWSLFIVVNAFAFLWTGILFVKGRLEETQIERDSKLPPAVHDLWFGNQLNPTLCGVDLKMFAYHPSLIGVGLFVEAFAYRQHELYGTVTPQMMLFLAFWWIYLFTHYVREDFMLSTWDIIAEKFGFMLVWGDLVYVPFFYCIAGWYLIDVVEPLPVPALVGIAAFHGLGHWIFRGANWQKDKYKRDPGAKIWGKPAETLGGKLLISGWWGIGRKINYTGELMVYLSFALCTGFHSWVPYVLPFSLLMLLTQRSGRDDKKCREKYGQLWQDYCAKARFRIIPFVF